MFESGGGGVGGRDQDALLRSIEAARAIVAFTGAGLSTECGIPDFRSPDSAWRRYPPVNFSDFLASDAMRREAWRRKFAMDDLYAVAAPGRGHRALARLAEQGKLVCVVTQNIDGLHQASGLPDDKIVELHGNGGYAACLDCGARYELATIREGLANGGSAPVCSCGGLVKSATIAFGQAMPREPLARAIAAARACDLFLVLGSSLVVQPAASLPVLAKEAGAELVIVNAQPTPLDDLADLVVRGDIGAALAPCLSCPAGRGTTPSRASLDLASDASMLSSPK